MTTPHQKTVLVTGASSGIGAATARALAAAGWLVYAGVRNLPPEPAESGSNITPVVLDVSNADSVATAAAHLSTELAGRGLDALVNNAGIGQVAPMEYVSADDLQKIFSVNVFGLVSVTQAMLPLLRAARGRIVNISSVGGLITIPFGGGLCATKHAVEAINEALRMELAPAGIAVIAIRPAAINSPAAQKLAEEVEHTIAGLPPEGRAQYEQSIRQFVRHMMEDETSGSSPDVVGEAIVQALESSNPASHYSVGKNAQVIQFLARWVPDKLRDKLLLHKLGLPDSEAS